MFIDLSIITTSSFFSPLTSLIQWIESCLNSLTLLKGSTLLQLTQGYIGPCLISLKKLENIRFLALKSSFLDFLTFSVFLLQVLAQITGCECLFFNSSNLFFGYKVLHRVSVLAMCLNTEVNDFLQTAHFSSLSGKMVICLLTLLLKNLICCFNILQKNFERYFKKNFHTVLINYRKTYVILSPSLNFSCFFVLCR